MKAYTDYPFLELGDTEYEEAPVRQVDVLYYDGDKRCRVSFNGVQEDIKAGYLYTAPVRSDEAYDNNLFIDIQKVKNIGGHYPSSKAAQITKSWVVYGPEYKPSSGKGPFYFRFLKDAWNKALTLGQGAKVIQKLKVSKRSGRSIWSGGDVEYEVLQ